MDDHEITTFPQPDDYRVTRFDSRSIFRAEMQMIRTRTLLAGVFAILLFLIPTPPQVARAQAVPCDNSQAESVIPTDKEGQPLMPKEIQDNAKIMKKLKDDRLTEGNIRRCLESNEPLTNHVIDFDWYAAAWVEIEDPKPALRIQDSVLWSFKEGQVNLAKLTKKTKEANGKVTDVVAGKIEWLNVTMGPSFSARGIEFTQKTSFNESRFPNPTDFADATFHDRASFMNASFVDHAHFLSTSFGNVADFDSAAFGGRANFLGTNFGDSAVFLRTTFYDLAAFDSATFDSDAFFHKAKFDNDASFEKAAFGDYTSFAQVTFAGDHTSFVDTAFGNTASFSDATFGNNADFSRAKFGNDTSFHKAKFDNDASFEKAAFGDYTSFAQVTFAGDHTSFVDTAFGNTASFSDATFGNNADFSRAKFGNDTSFHKAKFDNDASFEEATFGGDISLRGATVEDKLELGRTNWEGRADFREAMIQNLSWDGTHRPSSIKGAFDARKAEFKSLVIKEIHFLDLVDFSDAEFGRFEEILSAKDKSQTDSYGHEAGKPSSEQSEQKTDDFRREAGVFIFQNLIFEKEVDFLRATFRNDAIFVQNRFRSTWDLTGVNFQRKKGQVEQENPHLCLSFNRINKLFMEKEHLGYESSWSKYFVPSLGSLSPLRRSRIRGVVGDGSYSCSDFSDKSLGENEAGAILDKSHAESKSGKENEELWEIYKSIKSSFREANDRLAENEAWYLSMVAERKSQYSEVKDWISWISLEYWTFRIFADLPSRYGIDLYRVVLVSVVLMLVFAIIYWCYFLLHIHVYKWKLSVKLKPFPDQKRAFRFRPFERFFQSREKQERPLHPLKDALSLSGRAFFKLGLGTAYPRTPMLVGIASFEWIVGMYMLIHFLLAVKNTLPIAVPFLAVSG